MTQGLTVEINELIALKRFADSVHYRPENKAVRSGNHLSRLRGRGMAFSEVRHYQAGDEIRHMEWRVTARTGRPHIKVYQEERERPVVILTDFNASMYFGTRCAFKSVVAARLAALIAWTVIKHGDRVGGLFYSPEMHQEFIPKSREQAVLPLLASLSHFTQQKPWTNQSATSVPLHDALLRLRRVIKPGSMIVLISDFYQMTQACESHLRSLRAHNDVLAYHICDPLELSPPPPSLYALSNGQQTCILDTTDKKIAKEYQDWSNEQQLRIKTRLKRLTIPCHQDLSLLVRQTFPGRSYG